MTKIIPVRENTGNLEILPKHREFCLLKMYNSLILRVKDIAIFAAKMSMFSRSWIGLPSPFCVCNSHRLAVGQGKHSHREFENII